MRIYFSVNVLKICFVFLAFLTHWNSECQTPSLAWAKNVGGTDSERGFGLALDGTGNVYVTGFYAGTVDFDPGAGTFNLTSNGSIDIFILKLDDDGNFLWAKSVGGTDSDVGYSITVDGSGNVYTTGSFDGTVDFDPGAGIFNMTSVGPGSSDIFILRLDASGNFVWAKGIGGGDNADAGLSIVTDPSGNIYTTGRYELTADFDPGTGTFNLTATDGRDIFVSKLDDEGDLVWAKSIGGTEDDEGLSITLDPLGNVLVSGFYAETADFDPGAGTFNFTAEADEDAFILKLDASGNFIWAKSLSGDDTERALGITTDAVGNVYTTGFFGGVCDFDPGASVNQINAASYDIFISKLDASGNYSWAGSMGGVSLDQGRAIAVDASNNIYTAGSFVFTVDFDPGPGTFNLTYHGNAGNTETYIHKLTTVSTPLPTIISFTPSSGPITTPVTITGTNFSTTPANNIVRFNGTLAAATASTATSITTTVPSGAATGKITVTVSGNTATSATDFTVTAGNTISITTQPVFTYACLGSTATFSVDASGTTNITYHWQKYDGSDFTDLPEGSGYSGTNTKILSVNTAITGFPGNGEYRCRVSGDLASDEFSNDGDLTINSLPDPPDVIGETECVAPATLTLTAFGASDGDYNWYDVSTGGTVLETDGSFTTPSISTTKTFYVTIADTFCESERVPVSATISLLSKPALTSSEPLSGGVVNICDGEDCTLTAPGGFTVYTWSTGATTPQITVTSSGIYSVVVEDAGGCVSPSSDPVNVTVNPFPVSEITVNDNLLTATPGDSYQWFQNAEPVSGGTNQSFEFSALEYGVYRVAVTDNGCTTTSDDFIYLITEMEQLQSEWRIYPNPFTTDIFIIADRQPDEVSIYDSKGRWVKNFKPDQEQISLDDLTEGVYILNIRRGKQIFHIRITKTH